MAKLTLEQSIATVTKSLQRCKDLGMSEDVFLSIYRDRLLDEDLVDKNRRNEVHLAVNKHFNVNYAFKQVKGADPRLAESVDLKDRDLDVSVLDKQQPSTNQLSEENTMSQHSGNQNNASSQQNADNTTFDELHTIPVEKYTMTNNNTNTTATATVTGQQPHVDGQGPETSVELKLETETPLLAVPEGSSIKNSWLAAGGAVVGAGLALLKSDNNVGGYVGAAAGVAAAYFGTEHFFNEMEPTLLNRGVIVGAGVAVGAALTVGGNHAAGLFANKDEDGTVLELPSLANNTPAIDTAGLF